MANIWLGVKLTASAPVVYEFLPRSLDLILALTVFDSDAGDRLSQLEGQKSKSIHGGSTAFVADSNRSPRKRNRSLDGRGKCRRFAVR
jgi:hypothetical protein